MVVVRIHISQSGPVAQVGERIPDKDEVGSSTLSGAMRKEKVKRQKAKVSVRPFVAFAKLLSRKTRSFAFDSQARCFAVWRRGVKDAHLIVDQEDCGFESRRRR